MKTLVFLFFLAFAFNLSGQSQPPCNCTYPLKANTCWTVGPKGGKYCINKNGNKTYMPKSMKPVVVNGQTAKTI